MKNLIAFSIRNKAIILFLTVIFVGFSIYALMNIPVGAVPDITNNQVQVITVSRNLSTLDVEKFITYPVELEMANLPGVKEIRSISKFGLSVVTIVFDDKMGTYLPRQLVAEKIKAAQEKIPKEFGQPFMGPITTGLGEIYQYTLQVDPEYKDRYNLTDLRTIQDWIIKRQLSGIPGVVEINTWGGYLKQYEVAVSPERLKALRISLFDVFNALEKNNGVAGGGYIEKHEQTYFIRGEGLVKDLDDIRNIVITNRDGVPIYIKDVAQVGYGHATRFGAITANGEGETVMGQVMMLKDANSNVVINEVKRRIHEIQKQLPPGIRIVPVVDRSELIHRTTMTIIENLSLGFLLVFLVVLLLIGNLRTSLVISSVVPLSFLFAIAMMYIFGIDANLMSLGALDFGVIIDGAVIMVEFTVLMLTRQYDLFTGLDKYQARELRDKITLESSSKIIHSALFGQLIILIVFIPILSLQGVEGKMFRPMALAFSFALLGAMVLSFTYVPVVSAMFLKPQKEGKKNIANRILRFLQWSYEPVLRWSLRHKKIIIALSVVSLVLAGWIFARMGGEFVPTLDEGDFVIQPVIKTGTSLSETIKITSHIERIVKGFPEVEQVVSRIGAAEVPTDPMSMEECDIIIKLKPKKEWTTAKSKDALADSIKAALRAEIPDMEFEFTQPIEMRFNELITGIRSDIAIKIYGEDLDYLYRKANEIRDLIKDVPGAADVTVEKIAGLPQMTIKYDRRKIAKYGLNISDLNEIVTMAFAGMPVGTVFEGEKQFDMVVRFSENYRVDIENIRNTPVMLPNNEILPLSEFADISYTKGPAKISRDNTHRRIVIGINVRGRDMQSVVEDIQKIIDENVKLQTGYYIEYGGQFKNLIQAKKRLAIVTPVALILIFVILYFAFNSVKDALIIFTSIPLATVGGVIFLWARGMPFSISAGVGFIALFGITVLNGLVLIETFKEKMREGKMDIEEIVFKSAMEKVRPITLAAAAAAMGFLPMSVSTSAGAEVQRPLATVVIGGLVTATLLTLILIPVLYAIFYRKNKFKVNANKTLGIIVLALLIPSVSSGQTGGDKIINADSVIALVKRNNLELKSSQYLADARKSLVSTAFELDATTFSYTYDQTILDGDGNIIPLAGISQSIPFPTVFASKRQAQLNRWKAAFEQSRLTEYELTKQALQTYYEIVFWKELIVRYEFLDSIYERFARAAELRYKTGEGSYIDKLNADAKVRELKIRLQQAREQLRMAKYRLTVFTLTDTNFTVFDTKLPLLEFKMIDTANHPGILYYNSLVSAAKADLSLSRQAFLPSFDVEFMTGKTDRVYNVFGIGVNVPLDFWARKAYINSAKFNYLSQKSLAENYSESLKIRYQELLSELNKYKIALDYYNSEGKKLEQSLIQAAQKSYSAGEIDFFRYAQALEDALNIELSYLQNLIQYDFTVLEINFLK